jgi:hypothetical protein
MRCLHTAPTRVDIVAATVQWTCTRLGENIARALDYVFDQVHQPPSVVLVDEEMIDRLAPPLEWSLKKRDWWNKEPAVPRPSPIDDEQPDSNRDCSDPVVAPEPVDGTWAEGAERQMVASFPPSQTDDADRISMVALACCLQRLDGDKAQLLIRATGESDGFVEGGQAVLLCVPRFKRCLTRSSAAIEILTGEILLHELVHARQSFAQSEEAFWQHEVEAQFFGFGVLSASVHVGRRPL